MDCRGCGKPLDPTNFRIADGCPCNAARGANHGLVPPHTCNLVPSTYPVTASVEMFLAVSFAIDQELRKLSDDALLTITGPLAIDDNPAFDVKGLAIEIGDRVMWPGGDVATVVESGPDLAADHHDGSVGIIRWEGCRRLPRPEGFVPGTRRNPPRPPSFAQACVVPCSARRATGEEQPDVWWFERFYERRARAMFLARWHEAQGRAT